MGRIKKMGTDAVKLEVEPGFLAGKWHLVSMPWGFLYSCYQIT